MRSIGLVARAFSSAEEFLRSPELSRTGCLVVDFDMPKMSGLDLHNNLSRLGKEIPTVLITAYPSDDIPIAGLFEKSLLATQLDRGRPQYQLLNTTRAYALGKSQYHPELHFTPSSTRHD